MTESGEPSSVRVLIVDDEPLARRRIEELLEESETPSVVSHADDGNAAIDAIRRERPDIVFLDMQMPTVDGLEVMRRVGPDTMPVTVFVTAHDDFAVQAFELAAADYLLKPYSDERFDEAYRRARERVAHEDVEALREQVRLLLDASPGATKEPRYLKRIAVQSRGRLRVVAVAEIDHIVATGVYAELHGSDQAHLVRTSLNDLEGQLDPEEFFRIHRAVIVRLDQVELLIREGGGNCRVQLKSGIKLPVSRARREDLEIRLGRI